MRDDNMPYDEKSYEKGDEQQPDPIPTMITLPLFAEPTRPMRTAPTPRIPKKAKEQRNGRLVLFISIALSLLSVMACAGITIVPDITKTPNGPSLVSTSTPLAYTQATPTSSITTPTPITTELTPPPTSAPSLQLPPEHDIPTLCPYNGSFQTPTPAGTLPPTFTPKPTTTPPTATPTSTPTPPNFTPGPTPTCTPCPYFYNNTPYSQDQVEAALKQAADLYHLPHNMLYAIAQLESGWTPNLISCFYDIGLMQQKIGNWQSVDLLNIPECGLKATAYDPYTLEGGADLGAKTLAWITCYYSYWGGHYGTSLTNPSPGTLAWYYAQANLRYPDTKNADGSTNSASLCAAMFNDGSHPVYKAISATPEQVWSCPYTAVAGDHTLLEVVLSTYNQGIGTTNEQGIRNQWYVDYASQLITNFTGKYGVG